ncbi:hypothetical protein MMC31_007211, partial [Peltigera leucophlebia]|nr:hypothetical protein [Peltigera leucophlebia]
TLRESCAVLRRPVRRCSTHASRRFKRLYFLQEYRKCQGRKCRWEEWKAVLKEAEAIENIEPRNGALSAAVAMDTAERL